jgi:DUF1680 family protein
MDVHIMSKRLQTVFVIVCTVTLMTNHILAKNRGIIDTSCSPHVKLRSVDIDAVRWTKGFWADRFKQCCDVTLPHHWRLLSDPDHGHALTNLRIAAGLEEGEFAGVNWQDAWVYKWLEAAASIYNATGDEALDRKMDEVINIIARAQQNDGYIATQTTVTGRTRFGDSRYHELYTMGHLITAACLHHRITGEDNFLHIAIRAANYVYETFKDRPRELAHFPHNPSIIMALVELYRTTGERKYLDLANIFIDMRGAVHDGRGKGDDEQDKVPLRKETQVVGHQVFATYLYAGAADAYMETGDRSLLSTLERLWHDVTQKRMYVTGSHSAIHRGLSHRKGTMGGVVHEAAGPDYFLPNATAYNETCAQIGSFMWNWRMLVITGEARYADLMEQLIYNSILSGIGLDGASWFYTNVLRWHGQEHQLMSQDSHQRFQPGQPPRRTHICCPSNLLRTIAELGGYFYSVSDEGIWVNHYAANVFDIAMANGAAMKLEQETDYPWDGKIRITVNAPKRKEFAVMLRIPEWVREATLKVNGQAVRDDVRPGKYFRLNRIWSAGDVIELNLPMPVQLIEANPLVEELRNQVAIKRGPIVYCLESVDLPESIRISEVVIPHNIELKPRFDKELLTGVTVLQGKAEVCREGDWSNRLYRQLPPQKPRTVSIRLIPYYAWSNRGMAEMTVWMPLNR